MPYDPTAANSLFQELQIARVELEALKRERAMLVEMVSKSFSDCEDGTFSIYGADLEKLQNTLSATEPQATQWLNDKLFSETEELRRKLAGQQVLSRISCQAVKNYSDALSILDDGPDDSDVAMAIDRLRKAKELKKQLDDIGDGDCNELNAHLSAAKQEGYEQGYAKGSAVSVEAEIIAEQRGRDEVLRELSEQEPVGWYDEKNSANYDAEQVTLHDKTIFKPTIIRPSAPIADTKGE